MKTKVFGLIGGFCFIALGIWIFLEPKFYFSRYHRHVDFRGYEDFVTSFFVLGGVIIIWLGFRNNKGRNYQPSQLICPKCETVYRVAETNDSQCSKCEVGLEDLKGFYDRHPELKGDRADEGRIQ